MWVLQARVLETAFEITRGTRDTCEREAYKRYNTCPRPGMGWLRLVGLPHIPQLEIRLIKRTYEVASDFIPSEEC
jgi:hypothetical protein